MRRWILLLPVFVLAGCGGSGGGGNSSQSGSQSAAPQQTIAVSEAEYKLTPSTINVPKTGTVAFKITNNGHIGHALEVEGQGVEEKTGTIDPGSSATLTVNLSKTGSYEVYCPIDDHKNKGMKATLTVGGSSGSGAGEMSTNETTTTGQTTTDQKGGSPGY